MTKSKFVLIIIAVVLSGFVYYRISQTDKFSSENFQKSFIANPTAVYCLDLGYQNCIIEGSEGQTGVCIFPDREAYLDDYFGVGVWDHISGVNNDMPKSSARINYVFGLTHGTDDIVRIVLGECWVFWNKPSPIIPKALSVAPTYCTPAFTIAAPTFTGSPTSVVKSYVVVYMWKRIA